MPPLVRTRIAICLQEKWPEAAIKTLAVACYTGPRILQSVTVLASQRTYNYWLVDKLFLTKFTFLLILLPLALPNTSRAGKTQPC
jgi:hypothetical protein